jgi:hypothetical protein
MGIIESICTESRETTLAIRELESAFLWVEYSIKINGAHKVQVTDCDGGEPGA